MKQLFLTIILITLVSCKDGKKEVSIETNGVYSNTWVKEIKLNNGDKWLANSETNEGILKMKKSLKKASTNTLEEYYQLAEKLNNDKNYVIKNCSMKGDSHDNLHIWLLPLMAKIDALSKTKTTEDAAKLKQSIEDSINAYADYFE
ncbi:hypothetical protein [Polaribacter sp. L3A8]|uniref:hypothetical protein n=1 Tax=Polaribacter sp. L3A8 TaxID=2686361 RepID=UPI00131C44B1|nr:hypothetical protein [Polaribacter sp. L3A8]